MCSSSAYAFVSLDPWRTVVAWHLEKTRGDPPRVTLARRGERGG
jgi:hypothetical protein